MALLHTIDCSSYPGSHLASVPEVFAEASKAATPVSGPRGYPASARRVKEENVMEPNLEDQGTSKCVV